MVSPTYSCATGGTIQANTTDAYCLIPGGNPAMDVCCAQLGNSTVQFIPSCYSWCTLTPLPGTNHTAPGTAFAECLKSVNATAGYSGMICSLDAIQKNGTSSGNGAGSVRPDGKVGILGLVCAGLLTAALFGGL